MISVNIYYTGEKDNARKFVSEMESSGTAERIRKEKGNIRYSYFFPYDDAHSVLLIDSWVNEEALENHHHSEMMKAIISLREKYNLHMKVERYISEDKNLYEDYIRK